MLCLILLLSDCTTSPTLNTSEQSSQAERSPTPYIQQPNLPTPNSPKIRVPKPKLPRPQFPKSEAPQSQLPKPQIPKPQLPKPRFPEPQFPQVNFPEVDLPTVQAQQGPGATIYNVPADILFDFDQAEIRPDADAALQQIHASIDQRFPNAPIEINGHTDSVGNEGYNLRLSQQRAASVQRWFVAQGLRADRLTTQGLGERQPVPPMSTLISQIIPLGAKRTAELKSWCKATRIRFDLVLDSAIYLNLECDRNR